MANYYTTKIMAIRDIDEMYLNETPEKVIIYKITMKYGFSSKIVKERIKQIEEVHELEG